MLSRGAEPKLAYRNVFSYQVAIGRNIVWLVMGGCFGLCAVSCLGVLFHYVVGPVWFEFPCMSQNLTLAQALMWGGVVRGVRKRPYGPSYISSTVT